MLPFCYLDEELGAFTLPSAEEILARRAVVVTCGAAGLLREAYLPAGQPVTGSELPITFTHVLIDEAGQVCYLTISSRVSCQLYCTTLY